MQEIARILLQYPPNCQPSRIEPLGAAGGMSGAQFWRITPLLCESLPTPHPVVRGSPDPALAAGTVLILRRWPPEHPTADRLRLIHGVLGHAAQNGVLFLPIPITTRDDQTFVEHAGHLWELAPWLPGSADYERGPSAEKLQAALRALAQFHIATATFRVGGQTESLLGTSAIATDRHLTRLRDLSQGGTRELSHAITDATWPDLARLARQFLAQLPRAVPRAIAQLEQFTAATLPLQPCIRDIWHDHVLFIGNEVTGIVDFGALDIDTPATDIARLLGSLIGFSHPRSGEGQSAAWNAGLAAYSIVRPLSALEREAIHALANSGPILAGCNWIRWIYIERRIFEDHPRIVDRFRRLLHALPE